MGRPKKLKPPVGLDEALRKFLPNKKLEDRMKIFREWRRVNLRVKSQREPTDQEIVEEIKLFRKPDFDAANLNPIFWNRLKDFVPVYHKENRIIKARNAANKRWSKKNEKTS